jgi:hypothetical protein
MHRGITDALRTHLHAAVKMARCAAMRPRPQMALAIAALTIAGVATQARADERLPPASAVSGANGNRFALDLAGVRQGFVRAAVEPDKSAPAQQRLVLTAQDVAPS